MPSPDGQAELDAIHLEANQTTDDSLESTRRMRTLVEEAQDVGGKTIEMLDEQGEKLDKIESDNTNINANMKESEKTLTEIEKCCGLCICPYWMPCWSRRTKITDFDASWASNNNSGEGVKGQPVGKGNSGYVPDSGATSGNQQYVRRINDDAREDEMEENMQAVGSILGNLKNMAIDMGEEIETQNEQIDRINVGVENTDIRINEANERAEAILQK